jgi:hypothetical protein
LVLRRAPPALAGSGTVGAVLTDSELRYLSQVRPGVAEVVPWSSAIIVRIPAGYARIGRGACGCGGARAPCPICNFNEPFQHPNITSVMNSIVAMVCDRKEVDHP